MATGMGRHNIGVSKGPVVADTRRQLTRVSARLTFDASKSMLTPASSVTARALSSSFAVPNRLDGTVGPGLLLAFKVLFREYLDILTLRKILRA